MADPLEDLQMLDSKEIAQLLKINRRTVQQWLKNGRLPGIKLGRDWKARVRDIRALVERAEDADDIAAAEAALADPERIPHAQVRRELGLS